MELKLNDLQQIRRTLKRTPPPKVPLGASSAQNGAVPSDTGAASVASFKNRFEQKQAPSPKAPPGSSSRQDGESSKETVFSVASARAKFEQKPVNKTPSPWKQSNGNQSKNGSHRLDENSNASKGEPPRKTLPPFFRIGAAPYKPDKPDHLKFRLKKFEDKIILANGGTTAARISHEGRPGKQK